MRPTSPSHKPAAKHNSPCPPFRLPPIAGKVAWLPRAVSAHPRYSTHRQVVLPVYYGDMVETTQFKPLVTFHRYSGRNHSDSNVDRQGFPHLTIGSGPVKILVRAGQILQEPEEVEATPEPRRFNPFPFTKY
jgi:hypothetical protein